MYFIQGSEPDPVFFENRIPSVAIRIRNTLVDGGTGPGPAVSALLTGTHREYFHTCSTLSALSWVEIPVAAETHGQLALYNIFHVQSFEIYKSLRAWNKVRYGGQVCTWEYVCDIFCRQGLSYCSWVLIPKRRRVAANPKVWSDIRLTDQRVIKIRELMRAGGRP